MVVAAVVEHQGRYLVGLRPAHKQHGGLWEFPGGKVQAGEAPASALARELREELGVRMLGTPALLYECADEAHGLTIRFLATAIEGMPVCLEHDALAWRSPDELLRLPLAPSDARFVARALSSPT